MSADAVEDVLVGMLDFVALGVSAGTGGVGMSKSRNGRWQIVVGVGDRLVRVDDTNAALRLVSAEVVQVLSISYRNPVEGEFSAGLGRLDGNAVVAFLRLLVMGGPARARAKEEAARESLARIVEEATLEYQVDKVVSDAESLELDNKIKKEQLRGLRLANRREAEEVQALRLENQLRRKRIELGTNSDRELTELASQIVSAQSAAGHQGLGTTIWTPEQALKFVVENPRLVASVEAMQKRDIEVRLIELEHE
jgi:hypothetical protein